MTDYLREIEMLLGLQPLVRRSVENVFHNCLLENATNALLYPNHQNHTLLYVEEFLRNALYLLELDSEPDARFQLEVAKAILSNYAASSGSS
jgi:hypothetical protein